MRQRTAQARWQGALRDGKGTMRLGSGAFEGAYSFNSRMAPSSRSRSMPRTTVRSPGHSPGRRSPSMPRSRAQRRRD